jgi:sodium/potassium-transporting ATPase subunit alpha
VICLFNYKNNRWHLAGVVSAILIALAIIKLPLLQSAFGTANLSLWELHLALPFALGLLLLDELRRWLIGHNERQRIDNCFQQVR